LTRLGLPQSDDTVLRNLKRHAADRGETSTARIVGIDDWAWQKGCRYGTIMVDLERREVVDVLSDRSADSVARWLRQHASVEIVSRDRCGLYAEGARRGAPKARQVADRFHLVQNLRHTIEQQLSRAPSPARPLETTNADVDPCTLVASGSPYSWSELAEHRQLVRDGRRALRTSMFDQVKTLQARGDGIRTIACRTGLNWRTVEKWSRLEELPPRNVMGPKLTTPSTFQGHLSRRWAEGCTSGRTLLPEIKRLGYAGSFSHLERLLCQWRKAGRSASASASASAAVDVITLAALAVVPEVAVATTGPLASPIVAAALCVKPRGLLTRTQAAEVDALKAASSDFAAMRGLAMRFRGILRGRDIRPFAAWLQDADRCGIYGMRRFVRTLRQDLDAVRNAITELWSNGQTEGQINRLKTLKRAMYGRAGAELLRARMMPLRLAENHAD
jgi:hypothetical protein